MRKAIVAICASIFACGASSVAAQQAAPTGATAVPAAQGAAEQRAPITEQPVAMDALGRAALAGRLRTTALNGSVESPVMNVRLVIENRSAFFYTHVSGWATFYDSEGVRCGEGLFRLNALAPGEAAETDTPGLRLTCSPATWRIAATNLITRANEAITPAVASVVDPAGTADAESTRSVTANSTAPVVVPPLQISIDGEVLPLQLGRALNIDVRRRRRINIVVNAAP